MLAFPYDPKPVAATFPRRLVIARRLTLGARLLGLAVMLAGCEPDPAKSLCLQSGLSTMTEGDAECGDFRAVVVASLSVSKEKLGLEVLDDWRVADEPAPWLSNDEGGTDGMSSCIDKTIHLASRELGVDPCSNKAVSDCPPLETVARGRLARRVLCHEIGHAVLHSAGSACLDFNGQHDVGEIDLAFDAACADAMAWTQVSGGTGGER